MRREIDFPEKESALRDDVRVLGALVGEIIEEQGGEELFGIVESARVAAIQRREGTGDEAALGAILSGLTPATAEGVVRSFSSYFDVVNLAETAHRIRRRREHERAAADGGTPQRDGFHDLMLRLRDAGHTADEVLSLLDAVEIEPVFTAHPTESTRRAILEKHQRIARRLVERFDPSRPPSEERRSLARIRAEVTAAWQTEQHPCERPTVLDEMEFVLFFLTDVLYRIIPPFYESMSNAFRTVFGPASRRLPNILRFASWVGGDMDGNPNVDASTIRATLARHRTLILRRYHGEVLQLAGILTQTPSRVGFDEDLLACSREYAELFPDADADVSGRQQDMPYVLFLHRMAARLRATERDVSGAYLTPADLLEDLEIIERSLANHRGEHAGLFAVRRLVRRVESFGFHLATLDVRQDSEVHRRVTGRLLGDDAWTERPAAERARRLADVLSQDDGAPANAGSTTEEDDATLEVFRAIRECRERYGAGAVGPYIISMTQGADDLLSVLFLARRAGWAGVDDAGRSHVPLDVAPLLETVPDLEAGAAILRELLALPEYRQHLSARRDRQIVMVGYSDSNKDGGIAASRWALHRAQAAMVEPLEAAGIEVTFFHGRGGSISRGGGKTHRAVLASPRGSLRGRLRVTEQGEMIDAKFGLRGIAIRTLERSAVSVAFAVGMPRAEDPREPAWRSTIDLVAARSREVYRSLVYEDESFESYFRTATPIDVIERMRIGSRPAARRSKQGIGNLRAIPWVFAWTQNRHVLPGWYGLGSALEEAIDLHGFDEMSTMAREWLFAGTLLGDVEMVLAKADIGIAAQYAVLAGDRGARIFTMIEEEYARTVRSVLALRGIDELLDDDPTLRRNIRLRNPYVDPMSLLQVDLLRQWRADDRRDEALLQALVTTVQGISQGLQNTG